MGELQQVELEELRMGPWARATHRHCQNRLIADPKIQRGRSCFWQPPANKSNQITVSHLVVNGSRFSERAKTLGGLAFRPVTFLSITVHSLFTRHVQTRTLGAPYSEASVGELSLFSIEC